MNRTARKLGYEDDQNGIMRRYLREKKNWKQHLENSMHAIAESVDVLEPSTVAILGSGWLLDFPVQLFVDNDIKVDLYDIVQPYQIIHKHRKSTNLTFITQDIGGDLVDQIHDLAKKTLVKEQEINNFDPSGWKSLHDYDLVVSLNLLNQLDILALDYLRNRTKIGEDAVRLMRKKIQDSHIRSIRGFRSCVITDYKEKVFNMDNKCLAENNSLYADMDAFDTFSKWEWIFDTQGLYYSERKVTLDVMACRNFKP